MNEPRIRTSLVLLAAALALLAAPAALLRAQTHACPPLDTTAAWARVNRAWSTESAAGWSNDSLRQVLLALADTDQSMRKNFGTRVTDTTYGHQLMALDSTLARTMAGILDRYGLPTRQMVGAAGADAAMLIVQHNWPLQERVLALADSLPPGQLSPQAVAMLEDRVRVHQGKPQRYGTQFTMGADKRFHFAAAEDVAHMDARRAAVGMPPMRQYVCLLEGMGPPLDTESLPPGFRP